MLGNAGHGILLSCALLSFSLAIDDQACLFGGHLDDVTLELHKIVLRADIKDLQVEGLRILPISPQPISLGAQRPVAPVQTDWPADTLTQHLLIEHGDGRVSKIEARGLESSRVFLAPVGLAR